MSILGLRCTPRVAASRPVAVATWDHGQVAVETAWQVFHERGNVLDAVEEGVRVVEADPAVRTVGLGGYPDATGHVTLDASIMEGSGRCGAVAFLEGFMHPVSVARRVMEKSPHVFLVGEGAAAFARAEGFEEVDLLTPEARRDWERWKAQQGGSIPPPNLENTNRITEAHHDTVALLMVDTNGHLAGACSTSGAAFKWRGRVGDSPIIGAGLFVDDEVGAACATGWGEGVIRIAGSHLIVELMRQGDEPAVACRKAVERFRARSPEDPPRQVGFLALRRDGVVGAYSLLPGFTYAVRYADRGLQRIAAPSLHR